MNIGIYRPVYLHFYDDAKIECVTFRTLDYQTKRCRAEAHIFAKAGKYHVDMEIFKGDERLYHIQKTLYLRDGKNIIEEENQDFALTVDGNNAGDFVYTGTVAGVLVGICGHLLIKKFPKI